MVKAPTPEEEDRRRLCRERKVLTNERVQHVNRIKGLLFGQGVSGYEPLRRNRRQQLNELRTGDGRPCESISRPGSAGSSIGSNCCSSKSRRWRLSGTRCCRAKSRAARAGGHVTISMASGPNSPRFSGPKDCSGTSTIGASSSYAGLAPTPWQSGSVITSRSFDRQSSIADNTHSTRLAMARHQPQSALALWFKERVARNGGRHKRTTVVALARKLLVALWKYVTAGVVIEGAVMKTA